MSNLQLKCWQLDLARQMEPLAEIYTYIDIAKDNGYNSILLYLEDRIRTASYPYPADNESYSEDEIRLIVSYAQKRDIVLIPCVATLGHAERFLRHKELEYLSEVKDGMKNRFGLDADKNVFCLSNPDFYPFMEKYLGEVASLFPSGYFHVGLDEFFNFNLCPECRKAMPTLADEERVFETHLLRIRKCLQSHGKRIMMWSDMFEFYPHVMANLPTDIIMVDWQYQEDVRNYFGHLLDMQIEQRRQINDDLGFATVLASADQRFYNSVSTFRMSEENMPWGYLLTMWEKTDTYLYRTFPIICQFGRLLQGKSPETAWQETIEYLFGVSDPTFTRIIKLACLGPLTCHFREVDDDAFYTRPFRGMPLEQFESTRIVLEMLRRVEHQVTTELGRRVWFDLINQLEEKVIRSDFKESFQDTLEFGPSEKRTARSQAAAKMFRNLILRKEEQWQSFRPGITPNEYTECKDALFQKLDDHLARQNQQTMVRIRYGVPDPYVVNFVRIQLRCNDKWLTVVERGAFKGDTLDDVLFERVNLFEFDGTPEELSIECWGMGGRAVLYALVRDSEGNVYIPSAITKVEGTVEHPEFLLEDDGNFCWFGEQSTRRAYHHLGISETRHKVALMLKKCEL